MASTQPLDLITRSLVTIGAQAPGEPVPPAMANYAFDMANDLLDQWSNDKMLLFCVQEVIHELEGGQYIYTIGPGGMVGSTITGSIVGNTLTVSAIAAGAISIGQSVSGTGVISGTMITSQGPGPSGVTSVTIVSPGLGYSAVPTVTFTGGGGTGATAQAAVGFSSFIGPTGGTGYALGDIVTGGDGTGTRATFLVTGLAVTAISTTIVINEGQYTALPTTGTAVTGGTGTGATLAFGAGSFQVSAVTLTATGTGYTSAPTVGITGGTPLDAAVLAATTGQIVPATSGVGSGGNGTAALGAYSVNLPQSVSSITMQTFAPRPLRINSAFVRVINSASGVQDYPVVPIHYEQYETIGIKTLDGPWPRAVYYQPSEPLGVLNYWPNPSSGEMHLFCDTVLNRFQTLYDTIVLPQGYFMALMWSLAEVLIPAFPATGNAAETRALVPEFAARGRALIKRTNMQPQQVMRVDNAIVARNGRDAGWILNGGFN